MRQITWTAESGKDISLELQTERIVDADGDKITVPTYNLHLNIAGLPQIDDPKLTDDPNHGLLLDAGLISGQHVMVRVPAEHRAAVKELIAEYKAEINRRIDHDLAEAKVYEEGRERMRKVMGY